MKHFFLNIPSVAFVQDNPEKCVEFGFSSFQSLSPLLLPPRLTSSLYTSAVGSRSTCWVHVQYRQPEEPAMRSSLWGVKGLQHSMVVGTRGYVFEFSTDTDMLKL